jgi:hypothetical protein
MKNSYLFLTVLAIVFFGCKKNEEYKEHLNDPEFFHSAVKNLTDVIVHDIFSPPVASRIYMYPSVAAYSVIQKKYPDKYYELVDQLNGLSSTPEPKNDKIDYYLAAVHAYLEVGRSLIFSEDRLAAYQEDLYNELIEEGMPESILIASKEYGKTVAEHVLAWSKDDLYNATRTYPKYTIRKEDKYWKPTPPDYMDGIEPHWNKIRTVILDSATQFVPVPPLEFDLTEGSEFQKQLVEVFEEGEGKDQESLEIAQFWDCNPYVSHHMGHNMFVTKKITPGGHWIGITAIATRQSNNSFDETVNAYTYVSLSLFDAFISCWDEKWRSLVVRPETLINQYMDEDWKPLLQTPPFPEYTSGHSVISRAAAVSLTSLYGDNFHFSDTTELEYGLPVRKFKSFIHASEEAAISRLYGGIHYRMAIDEGVNQGQKVGEFIVNNLKTIKE